jgi:Flp pilus assembly protein TadB
MIQRLQARKRAKALLGNINSPVIRPTPLRFQSGKGIALLRQAGVPESRSLLVFLCGMSAVVTVITFHQILSLWLLPITVMAGGAAPFVWILRRAESRALDFAEDFPTVLQATASGLSAGNTALIAIERAVYLLPRGNLARDAVDKLISSLQSGESRESAISQFGVDIRLPELSLFRTAFRLSLENGGAFAPTLERLAQVLRDRLTLIRSARAVTAVMRMTANVLLIVAPFVLVMISLRTENFFETILYHPVANTLASVGFGLIVLNFLLLRRMSAFKP